MIENNETENSKTEETKKSEKSSRSEINRTNGTAAKPDRDSKCTNSVQVNSVPVSFVEQVKAEDKGEYRDFLSLTSILKLTILSKNQN